MGNRRDADGKEVKDVSSVSENLILCEVPPVSVTTLLLAHNNKSPTKEEKVAQTRTEKEGNTSVDVVGHKD